MKKDKIKNTFPEQTEPIKLSGLDDGKGAGEINDLPEDEDSGISTNARNYETNTSRSSGEEINNETVNVPGTDEGRTNEGQDRARVSDTRKNLEHDGSPRQSNVPQEDIEDVEEKSPGVRDTFY